VFVDDGSTDDSSNLLRDIALQDGRVTVITLPEIPESQPRWERI